jgi:hypothetical protein
MKRQVTNMTNKEIEEYKKKFAKIKNKVNNIAEKDPLDERLKMLVEGITEAQKLADDVCACKYYGKALRDISEILNVVKGRIFNAGEIDILKQRFAACEDIYKELCRNIYDALNTEEMFNACVCAEKSCRWAFWATMTALLSLVLTWYLN